MVRSAAAVLALLILPSFAQAQEPVGTHTVVDEDTLWDLAALYYQNPFEWRVIWEANQDSIADPNLIFPNEVFIIPGLPGQTDTVAEIEPEEVDQPEPVEPTEAAEPDLVQFGFRQARRAEQVRSIFYRDTTNSETMVGGASDPNYLAVTRDGVYSAPWVVPFDTEPGSTGAVQGFAREGSRASNIGMFDRVSVEMDMPARVGAELQIFRVMHGIDMVGQVVVPTGTMTVSLIGNDGVVGTVNRVYHRIQPGDLVRPVPEYSLERGDRAETISGGSEAMIMGFAGEQEINDLGHIAFLDLGSRDGIVIGDEFVLYGTAIPTETDGALQVVGVTETMAAARITQLDGNVFRQGSVVRLARKMP